MAAVKIMVVGQSKIWFFLSVLLLLVKIVVVAQEPADLLFVGLDLNPCSILIFDSIISNLRFALYTYQLLLSLSHTSENHKLAHMCKVFSHSHNTVQCS